LRFQPVDNSTHAAGTPAHPDLWISLTLPATKQLDRHRLYRSAWAIQAPRISSMLLPVMFAAIAALNNRNATLSPRTNGICLMFDSPG
jgi:hypothetical protein